jgi:hypothetical protein
MKQKILILANSSTFKAPPRGIQANRLINELGKTYNVYLITSTRSIPDASQYFEISINIFKIAESNKYLKYLHKVFSPILGTIDVLYYFKAYLIIKKIIHGKKQFSAVISFAHSFTNSLLGSKLKRMYDIDHVAFFSDPLSFNSYLTRGKISLFIALKIEKYIIDNSNFVVLPSLTMQKRYKQIFEAHENKFVYIPHNYAKIKSVNWKGTTSNRISYVGGLNKKRNIEKLGEAILFHQDFFINNNIYFEFYGSFSKDNIQGIKKINSIIINYKGYIEYKDVEALYNNSFALLVIDAEIENSPYLPSKLIEMLPYGIPILGLTTRNSETARVLKETNNFVIYYDELETTLPKIINDIEYFSFKAESIKEFQIENVTKKWIDLIDGTFQE